MASVTATQLRLWSGLGALERGPFTTWTTSTETGPTIAFITSETQTAEPTFKTVLFSLERHLTSEPKSGDHRSW